MAWKNGFHVAEGGRSGNEIVQRGQLGQPDVVHLTRSKLWMIQNVVGVRPKLQAELIPDSKTFYETYIEVVDGPQAEVVAGAIRECSQASADEAGVRIVGKISNCIPGGVR